MATTGAVRHLTVLYDADCPLCVHIRHWLLAQRRLLPIALVPAASWEARRRFPRLDHASTLREITVVGDSGQVWTGTDAFIVCLWALVEHRPKANWLATPPAARSPGPPCSRPPRGGRPCAPKARPRPSRDRPVTTSAPSPDRLIHRD
ncbi:DCC1-like thiol-disulfide oxidoreductase family protein [Streptomyces virginiae]|uniref:thiol-disulfide oxidoreductase DCC family protein n=1 Tax=Streptomyces virginiae TaxID=1961 RepID=UPI003689444E